VTLAPEAPSTPETAAPEPPSPAQERLEAVRRWLAVHVRRPRGVKAVRAGLLLALVILLLLAVAGFRALRPVHDGTVVPLTAMQQAASQHDVLSSVLYDQDARVVAETRAGPMVASYTRSDSETSALVRLLASSGPVRVDPQTDKQMVRIGLQFLLPVTLLSLLFGLPHDPQPRGGRRG
jgi:hypothetical protein